MVVPRAPVLGSERGWAISSGVLRLPFQLRRVQLCYQALGRDSAKGVFADGFDFPPVHRPSRRMPIHPLEPT